MVRASVSYAQFKTLKASIPVGLLAPVLYIDQTDSGYGNSRFLTSLVVSGLNVAIFFEIVGDFGVSQKPAAFAVDFPAAIQVDSLVIE